MEKIVPYLIIGAVALVILIILIKNICIVQQSRAYVIERLGAFSQVWEVGIHFKLPFVERIARRVSLKEQVLDYPPQPVITKDNVTMQIDTVVYFQITDPKLYTYGVEQPMVAMETLTATTLRNIIGDLELDQTLTSRDVINTKMRAILDEATDPWGIKVTRVELKNILPPQDIQNSMEKQMKAERDRRQAILQAEGTKRSQILVAEGEKESAILRADAEKQSAILRAQGQAEAILAVQKATAEAMQMLNDACPNDQVIKLKALEAMQKVADGKATKIIIPSELQGLAGPCGRTGRDRPRAEAVKKTGGRPFSGPAVFAGRKPLARPVVMIGKVGRYVQKIPHAAAGLAPCAGSLSYLLRCCRAGHERRPVRARRRAGRADRALCGRRGGLSAADGHVLLRLRAAHGLALPGRGCGGPCRHRPRAWRGRGDIPAGDDALCGQRLQRPGLRCDRHRSLRRQRHARSCAVCP